MTERKKSSSNRSTRRKPARKTAAKPRASRARTAPRRRAGVTRKRNLKRSSSRWLRRAGAAAIFGASAFLGLLLAAPVSEIAARVDPASQRIEAIAVQGLQRLDARVVAAASGIARGQARSAVDPERVAQRIEAHPWVRSATVLEGPIGPLVVRVEERTPQAVLRVEGTHRYRLVDETGTPFAAAREDDLRTLPHVSSVSELPMNTPNALLAQAVEIGHQAQRSGLMAISGSQPQSWVPELRLPTRPDGDGWIIAAQGRAIEAVLGFDDLGAKMSRLARMLRSAPKALARAGRVDMRFGEHAVMQVEESGSRK